MKKGNQRRIVFLLGMLCLFLLPFTTGMVRGAVVTGPDTLTLGITPSDPFAIGVVRADNDLFNIMVRGDSKGRILTFDETFQDQSDQAYDPDTNEEMTLTNPQNGLNIWNPDAQTRWIAVANNSEETGNFTFSFVKQVVTVTENPTTIELNTSLSVLNLEMEVEANTPYMLLTKQILGNFLAVVTSMTAIDAQGYAVAQPTTGRVIGGNTYSVFVPKHSGKMIVAMTYGTLASRVIVSFSLRKINITPVTPGTPVSMGDDLLTITDQQAQNKQLTMYAFAMDVTAGESYRYYATVMNAGLSGAAAWSWFVFNPGVNGYTAATGTTATINLGGDIATASGKVIIAFVEDYWREGYQYNVLMEKPPVLSQGINTTMQYTAEPFTDTSIQLDIPATGILRINGTEDPAASPLTIDGLWYRLGGNALMGITNTYTIDVSSGTGDHDTMYLVRPGTYFIQLENSGNNQRSKINITTTLYPNVFDSGLNIWEDTWDDVSDSWQGFNDSTDFNHVTFMDLGKGTGAKVAKAFKLTVDQITFIKLRFQLQIEQNPSMNTSDDYSGRFQYALFGPHGYYTNEPFLWEITSNAAVPTLNFNNGSFVTDRTRESGFITLPGAGDYYLLIGLDDWKNVTDPLEEWILNGSVVLSVGIQSQNPYIYWGNYSITKEPSDHAYAEGTGFASQNFMDFDNGYNTSSYYGNGLVTPYNARRHYLGAIFEVTGGRAYAWTQVVLYYEDSFGLYTTGGDILNERNQNGISIIYDGFWGPAGRQYYNTKIDYQDSLTGDPWEGQTDAVSTTGNYALEFGVYAGSFLLWVPTNNEWTVGDKDLNQKLGIEITQYETPAAVVVRYSAPGAISWEVYVILISAIGGGAAAVVLVYAWRTGKLKR